MLGDPPVCVSLSGSRGGQAAGQAPPLFGVLPGSRWCQARMVELEVLGWVAWWMGVTHDR